MGQIAYTVGRRGSQAVVLGAVVAVVVAVAALSVLTIAGCLGGAGYLVWGLL